MRVAVVLILVVIETGWLPGAKTGFYCEDRNIAHTFSGDTISLNLLLGVSFVAPLIAVSTKLRKQRVIFNWWLLEHNYNLCKIFNLWLIVILSSLHLCGNFQKKLTIQIFTAATIFNIIYIFWQCHKFLETPPAGTYLILKASSFNTIWQTK